MNGGIEQPFLALAVWLTVWGPLVAAGEPGMARPAQKPSAGTEAGHAAAETQALIRALKTDEDPSKRRDAALRIAEEHWSLPKETIEPLADAIRSDKEEMVRAAAADALLCDNGSTEVPWRVLIAALHDVSPRVRVRAAAIIDAQLGPREDIDARKGADEPALVEAAQDKDPVVRGLVALAVGEKTADVKAALPVLLAALKQEDAAPIPREIRWSGRFEDACLQFVGDIGPDAKSAVSALLERLAKMKSPGSNDFRADPEASRVAATVDTLVRIGPVAVPEIVAQLKSKQPVPRTVAALALVDLGEHREEAAAALIRSLHDPCGGRCVFTHIQRFDVVALARCGPEAVPSLLKARKDGEIAGLVFEALWLMRDGNDVDAVVARLIEALSHRKPSIRSAAADALGWMGANAEPAVPALQKATRDDSPAVARAASDSLARIYVGRIKADDDLKLIADLDKLGYLDLSGLKIGDRGLTHLSGLRDLRRLILPNTITDAGLAHLKGLTKLTDLYLDGGLLGDDKVGSQITDAGLRNLAEMTKLRTLSLRGASQITDAGMPQLRRLRKNLWTLDLRGTQVTDAGLVDLARLKNLLWLDLSDHITDAGLPKLESLANLSHLHLAKSKVTAEGVQKLKKALPKCEIEYEKRKPLMNADGPRLP